VALAVGVTSCAESEREGTGNESDEGGGTFTFGAAGAPEMFDPLYATDGETFRVTRQMFEGLLDIEPGGAEVIPGLATEWTSNEDGTVWDFTLREGVKFHDGTDFNAEAVCANFERMFDQNEAGQVAAGDLEPYGPKLGEIALEAGAGRLLGENEREEGAVRVVRLDEAPDVGRLVGLGEQAREAGRDGDRVCDPLGVSPAELQALEPVEELVGREVPGERGEAGPPGRDVRREALPLRVEAADQTDGLRVGGEMGLDRLREPELAHAQDRRFDPRLPEQELKLVP